MHHFRKINAWESTFYIDDRRTLSHTYFSICAEKNYIQVASICRRNNSLGSASNFFTRIPTYSYCLCALHILAIENNCKSEDAPEKSDPEAKSSIRYKDSFVALPIRRICPFFPLFRSQTT